VYFNFKPTQPQNELHRAYIIW